MPINKPNDSNSLGHREKVKCPMKATRIALLLVALAIPAAADIPFASSIHLNPSGAPSVDLGFFFDSLSPYGNWVETPAHGWAFAPTVASTWRPYSDGQWIQSDAGWTWLTDEPFGWATYHYGRWDLNPDYGWLWVPGDQWAPAWVDWRATDDVVGWAPLPPSYVVSPRLSFRRANVVLPPEAYVFVPQREFLSSRVAFFALPPGQAKKLFRSSRQFTRYRFANNLIINDGVPFVTVQRRIGRRIPRYQLIDLEPRFWGVRPRARFAGNRVEIFRPTVLRTAVAVPPARPFARRSVMTVHDAARVRKVARARAVAFNLPPPRSAFVSQRDFGHSRGVGPNPRQVVVGRDFGKSRGIGKGKDVRRKVEVQRKAVRPPRGVSTWHVKAERHSSSRRVSSSGRAHVQRQSVRHTQRGHTRQKAVRPSRQGGGGGKAMTRRGGGGGRQGKRGGRGH